MYQKQSYAIILGMKNQEEKDNVLGNIVRYSSSKIFARIIRLLNAFIKPKLLSPELFGLWNILHVVENYATYAHLGSTTSMGYLVPYHNSKNEISKSNEIKASAYYGSLFMYLFISGVIIIAGIVGYDMDLKLRFGLLTIGILIVMEWYYEYTTNLLRANQQFKFLSSLNYLKPSIMVSLSAILMYLFSIYGLYISAILTDICIVFYMRSNIKKEKHVMFQFRIFKDLIKMGFPIMIFGFCILLIKTCDRLVVSYFLGFEQLGYYAMAIMVTTFIRQVVESARDVIEVKMMKDLHKLSQEELLREYVFKPMINTAYYYPFLIAAAFFIAPPLISLILPKYAPGILPTQIIIVGGYFLALTFLMRGIIIANRWQLKSLIVIIPTIISNIILSMVLIRLGLGINGVALSSSFSNVILFIGFLMFVKNKYKHLVGNWSNYIKALFLPFFTLPLLLSLLQFAANSMHIDKYISAMVNLVLFCLIMITMINYVHKKYILLTRFNLKELKETLIV